MQRISYFILCILFETGLMAQGEKSIDIGIHSSLSYNSRIPGLGFTPTLSYAHNKFQFHYGLDIYSPTQKTILGHNIGIKYFLNGNSSKPGFFGDMNFQFVRYGMGCLWNVPYNFVPSDSDFRCMNSVSVNSFICTLGIGYKWDFLRRFSFSAALGGGLNFFNAKYSAVNTDKSDMYMKEKGNVTKPIGYGRIGLSYRLWKM